MSVLNFSPHVLEYLVRVKGYTNEDGDYIEGREYWETDYCMCDMVPAGKANTIVTVDGQVEPYSYTIYNLPRCCRKFDYGDKVRIKFFGRECEKQEFMVKGFHRYQHQCKMWV